MDKKTKLKVTLITIMGIVVAYIYIYRGQLTNEFRMAEWDKDEPQGRLIDGRKEGEWRTYFKNGKLANVENFLNDTLHGKYTSYRPTGKYHIRCNYYKGVQVDSFFRYHPNGVLNSVEFYDNEGRQQGSFKIYYDNGQLSQTGQVVNGQLDGESRVFYESGKLKEVNYYKQQQRTGKWIWLSETGDTTKIESY